ncbi:MAG: glycosyltransferase family 4 protein, partial [bacterium]
VYREAMLFGRPWIERYIAKKGIPIIFDFDDAIWMPVKSQTGISPILKRFIKSTKKFDEIMKLSTHVVAGNNYLAQHAQLLNKHVSVIPTVVDTDYYKPVEGTKEQEKKLVIGWIGSGSTSVYLKLLDNIWKQLKSSSLSKRNDADVLSPSFVKEGQGEFEYPVLPSAVHPFMKGELDDALILKVIGGVYTPDGIQTTNVRWSLDTELAGMAEFDIGIMPLPDDEWAKGKCGLKALQYMAMGIPCVASPVGVNTEIIQDGVNGFLAKDEKEWVEKLSLLIENPELRQRLGRAGRKTVEERYSVKVWAQRYVEIVRKVVG